MRRDMAQVDGRYRAGAFGHGAPRRRLHDSGVYQQVDLPFQQRIEQTDPVGKIGIGQRPAGACPVGDLPHRQIGGPVAVDDVIGRIDHLPLALGRAQPRAALLLRPCHSALA